MMTAVKWLLNLLARTVVLRMMSLVPVTHIITWVLQKTWPLESIVSPSFLLLLSCLSAPVLVYHAFILPLWKARQHREAKKLLRKTRSHKRLKTLVARAYGKLRLVRNPALMDPNQDPPPNLAFMEEEAKVAVLRLAHELHRRRGDTERQDHPAVEYTADKLLNKEDWHSYLTSKHAQLSGEE